MFSFTYKKKSYRRLKFWGRLDEEDFQNGGLPSFFSREQLMYYYSGYN